jgi:ADP-heptose:LPS heptosyltransferase
VLFHRKKFIFKKNNISHHLDQLTNFFKFDCFNLMIHTSDEEVKEVEKTISKRFKYVVICPGGNWIPKLWGVKNFVKLMKNIKRDYSNVKFLIVGSLIEKKYYFQDVVNEINNNDIIDLMGASLTLTSAYMKKSDLFIGNDSGLMHLSAASNLATIGLFGPTDDKIYAPKGISCFVVRTKEDYEYFKKNICEPNKSYMQSINEESIIGLIQKNKLL